MAGTLTAATIDSGAASTAPTFSANGTQIGTLCRAWVQFDGTGAINSSFNTTSVTRIATGQFTIVFTNAMSDAKYSITANGSPGLVPWPSSVAAGQMQLNFRTVADATTYSNPTIGSLAIFR